MRYAICADCDGINVAIMFMFAVDWPFPFMLLARSISALRCFINQNFDQKIFWTYFIFFTPTTNSLLYDDASGTHPNDKNNTN